MLWKNQPCRPSALFILLMLLHSSAQFLFPTSVEIGPQGAFMFRGESLVVWCNVTDSESDVDVEKLYFEIYNGPNHFTIPKEDTTSFNGSTFIVLNITEQYLSYNTIHCMEEGHMWDSTFIFVEESMANVTDVNAVYNYERNFNVSWSLGKSYLNKIQVRVCWNPYSPPVESTTSCSMETSGNSISLEITGQSIMFVSFMVYSELRSKRPDPEFVLTPQPDSATSVVKFIVNNYLKPRAPSGFTIVGASAFSFDLQWEDPPYFRHSKEIFRYRVEVRAEHSNAFTRLVDGDELSYPATKVPIELQGLIPYTKYVVRLQVKPLHHGYWSEPVETRNSTAAAQPISGPPVTNTSFYLESCQGNNRKLIVYWKKISDRNLQGVLKGYTVKDFKTGLSTPRVPEANFFESNIACSQPHYFGIFAENSVGSSQTPSSVFIPAEKDLLQLNKDLDFHVKEDTHIGYGRKVLLARWNSTPVTEANAWMLTFYICSESTPMTCFGDFDARRVNFADNQLLLNDVPLNQTLIGYAVEDGIGTKTGIQWTPCVYQDENLPALSLELRVEAGHTDKSIMISWNLPRCSRSTKTLITSMHLFLCQEEATPCNRTKDGDTEKCMYHKVLDTREMSYVWTGLEKDTIYYLYGQAESTGGLSVCAGPILASVASTFSSSQSNTSYIIGVVLTVLTVVVIIAAVGMFLIRRYHKRKRHFQKLMVQAPDIMKQMSGGLKFKKQFSDESGVFTATNSQEDYTSSQGPAQVASECLTDITEEITLSNDRLQKGAEPIWSSSAQTRPAANEPHGCEDNSKPATQPKVAPTLTTNVGLQRKNMDGYTKHENNQFVEDSHENNKASDVGLSRPSTLDENETQSGSPPLKFTIRSPKNMDEYTKLENDQSVEASQDGKGGFDVGLSSLSALEEELERDENDTQSCSPPFTFTIGSQKSMDDYTRLENDQLGDASKDGKGGSDLELSSLSALEEKLERDENDTQSESPTLTFTVGRQRKSVDDHVKPKNNQLVKSSRDEKGGSDLELSSPSALEEKLERHENGSQSGSPILNFTNLAPRTMMDDYTKLTNNRLVEGNQDEKGDSDVGVTSSSIPENNVERLGNDSFYTPASVAETASQWIADHYNLIVKEGSLKPAPTVDDHLTLDKGTSANPTNTIDANMGTTDVSKSHNSPSLQGVDKKHDSFRPITVYLPHSQNSFLIQNVTGAEERVIPLLDNSDSCNVDYHSSLDV